MRIHSAFDDIYSAAMPDKDETSPFGVHVERFPLKGNNYRMFATMPNGEPRAHQMEYSVHPETKSLKFQETRHDSRSPEKDRGMAQWTMHDYAHMYHPDYHEHDPRYDEPRKEVPKGPTKFYHGTTVANVTHILPANQHGGQVVFPDVTDKDYAYASTKPEDAWDYAEKAWNNDDEGRRPRVYEVRPMGGMKHVEEDPQHDAQGNHRFNNLNDFRSKKGWKVVREVAMPESMGDPEEWDR